MKFSPLYVFYLLYTLFSPVISDAQVFNGLNRATPHIEAYFVQENLIIEQDTPFFNVLVVTNRGTAREEVWIEINTPMGWSVMVDNAQSFLINPGDSALIPVRAAASREVEGEIGYSLIAAINDRRGETLANAYCFIKVPRRSDIRFRPLTRVSYFDQQTGESELSFIISNMGNVNEIVYLNFQTTPNLILQNEENEILNMDVVVRARSDTVITIPVVRSQDVNIEASNFYRADLRVLTSDRTFNTSFWFNNLSYRFRYEIPEGERVLIAELAAQNLLAMQNPTFMGGVGGNILLRRARDINYRLHIFGAGPQRSFLQQSFIRLAYNTPRTNVEIGDIAGIQLKYGAGKGARLSHLITDRFRLSVMGNRNPFRPITNYGMMAEEKYTPLNLMARLAQSDNQVLNNRAHLAGIRGNLGLAPGHTLRADVAVSNVEYMTPGTQAFGFGINLDYSGRIGNTTIRLNEEFGSKYFYGPMSGRHNFRGQISTPLGTNLDADLNINDHRIIPLMETPEGITSGMFFETTTANLRFRRLMERNFILFAGPILERKSTSSFVFYDGANPFTTHSSKINVGFRLTDAAGLTISPSLTLGYTFVTDYSMPDPAIFVFDPGRNNNIFNSQFTLNLRRGRWGAFFNYFFGPHAVTQELSQFYYNISTNSIRILPYLETFIHRDRIKLTSRLNFMHDFTFKTTRYHLINQLDMYLRHNITLTLLNTFNYQLTRDLLTDDAFQYSHNYVELRLRKEFDWNQPRIKYYNLTINLFKDLNGNLRREFADPGVRDVLVSITSIDPLKYTDFAVDYEPPGKMVSIRLLTGMQGTIVYENLPMGLYRIELVNIGPGLNSFFPDQNEFIVNVTGHQTFYVPYLERNRIFGRVVMNRSKISNLGTIEVSNLRITATDSKGRTTTTLTGANGEFEMYVPSIDHYIVTINNIFQEHFNLRQNNFRANLNGFKQFEVNFVFDEIRRHIEFAPSPGELQAEIRRVRRTNLTGTVRDATTLQGLRAQVEIINTETNETVVRTITDRATGRYSTSFATQENFAILITAPDHWMHSERLVLDPYLTIQDATRDVLLQNIVVGSKFQFGNLRFASGSSELPTAALPELDRLISQLQGNPNVRIRIIGHSDAVEALNNVNLSARRAEVVMRYMVENGFTNIEFTGLESMEPVAPSDTEANRLLNRRVEIVIVDK